MRVFRLAGVFFLLVIFPGLSWLYLNRGMDYRLEILEEIQDFGNVKKNVNVQSSDGIVVDSNFFTKHLVVWIPENNDPKRNEQLEPLLAQFQHREDVRFLFTDNLNDQLTPLPNPFDTSAICMSIPLESDVYSKLWQSIGEPIYSEDSETRIPDEINHAVYQVPQEYFVLTNTQGTILNYYNYKQNERLGRLVEHLALILPFDSEPDAIVRRTKEK